MMSRILSSCLLLFCISSIAEAQYCTPEANCTIGDGIRLVAIGPFSNSSDCESDMGIPGYGDFTDLDGLILGQGVTYESSFLSDYTNQEFSIWIDADDSESFEPTELIMADLVVGTELVGTTITIPADMAMGPHRMRVKATWINPSSEDPCSHLSTYGEIEDYTVIISEPPSCINVSGVETTVVSANAATITWVDPGTSTAWDVEWGPAGFEPTGEPSPGLDDIVMPIELTSLNAVTEYDVYVRADCGQDNETDVSVWTSAYTFITACGAVNPDYYLDWNSGAGECWEYYGLGTLDEGPQDGGASNWIDDGFGNFPGLNFGSQGLYSSGSNSHQWMVSPDFNLTGGPFQVEYDIALTAGFSPDQVQMGVDDKVVFLISDDAGENWNTLFAWEEGTDIAPSGEHMVHNLSSYADEVVRFAYYVTTGEDDDNFLAFHTFLDNFRVQGQGSPMLVTIDNVVEPNCFQFGGNPLADVLISISGGVAPYTFAWSNDSDNEDLIDAEAGTYTLMVTDSEGTTYESDPIDVPGTPVFTFTATVTDESYDGAADGSIEITDITGGDGSYTLFWNNGSIDFAIDGLIDAFWCVTATDGASCTTDSCFEVLAGLPSALLELDEEIGMRVFPNPTANGIVSLEADLSSSPDWLLEISDPLGRSVLTQQLNGLGRHREVLDLNAFANGVYRLSLIRVSDGKRASMPLIKQ